MVASDLCTPAPTDPAAVSLTPPPLVREVVPLISKEENKRSENEVDTFSEKEKENKNKEALNEITPDWSVRSDVFDWMPRQSKQTTTIRNDINLNEAERASMLNDNLIKNDININIYHNLSEMEEYDYESTFRQLTAADTPPSGRTRSKVNADITQSSRGRSKSISESKSDATSSQPTRKEIDNYLQRIKEKENNLTTANTVSVYTAVLTPQNSGANFNSSSLPSSSMSTPNVNGLTATELAKALGTQNILASRNECRDAVAKDALSSKDPYEILSFLRTLRENLNRFVDPSGITGLPYKTLDEAFVDGVTQACFVGPAYGIYRGVIKRNPPRITFDGFATALKTLYCAELTDATIMGDASYFRWEPLETPADAAIRLEISLNALSIPCSAAETKRFFVYGCKGTHPRLHQKLVLFEHSGKIWSDPSVTLDDIVKYCNIKCRDLWLPRHGDNDVGSKLANLEKLIMKMSTPSASPPAVRSYDRPVKRNIVNYVQSMGLEPETPSDFSTALTIFTSNVGAPTEEELMDFNREKNLVLNAFNRGTPSYATGVPHWGRDRGNFAGNCFICDKPGHRSNECDLMAFAKSAAGMDSFQKWKDEQNKGISDTQPTNVTNHNPKAVNEVILPALQSDVSLSDLDLTVSFLNKNLLDKQIPETFVFDTLKISPSACNAADNLQKTYKQF